MEITPFRGVGNLLFGDERQVAGSKLAAEFTTFEKGVGEVATDAFDSLGLHLYYDDSERLEFVEAFAPAQITFRGIHFLERFVEAVISEMQAIGFESTDADVGVNFPDAGIALTVADGIVEGVAAHRKGYYEDATGSLGQ